MWGGADGVRIINLLTQEGSHKAGSKPGKATEPDVNHALRALKKIIEREKFSSIALPRLATGVGGLSWEQVKPLIENQLGELDIPIYVYVKFMKGAKANEPS